MNGAVLTTEQRLDRKRALESELAVVRSQKAEVLRAIEQISKKQRLGGPLPPAAQVGHDAKVAHEQRVHKEEQGKVWRKCSELVKALLKSREVSLYFGEPVRTDLFPTYPTVIRHPMDLGTIKRRVDTGRYTDVYKFRDDMRLTFENCRVFNPNATDHVRKLGDNTSDKFEAKWVEHGVEAAWEAEARRHELQMQRLDAESTPLPEKIKEVDAELQSLVEKARAREAPLAPPGPGRDMTFEEKRKLSHSMSALPGERLARVVEIVHERQPELEAGDGEEMELDVDALEAGTLWALHSYVEAVLAEVEGKGARPAAAAGAGAGAGDAAAAEGKATAGGEGSDSEEGVGSKGNDSNMGDTAGGAGPQSAPRGADMTTFVSATGPQGAQPQILRNATQKKDVQLQNVGAWATLTQSQQAAKEEAAVEAAAGEGGEGGGDDLWHEFQGRASQERAAEEKKAALEEEQRRGREAEAAAAAEAERAARAEAEAAAARAEAEAAERRRREERELRHLSTRGAEDEDAEMLRRAGHESGAELAELGLAARQDEDEGEDEPMEEI